VRLLSFTFEYKLKLGLGYRAVWLAR